jgi:hypothetical protein
MTTLSQSTFCDRRAKCQATFRAIFFEGKMLLQFSAQPFTKSPPWCHFSHASIHNFDLERRACQRLAGQARENSSKNTACHAHLERHNNGARHLSRKIATLPRP